MDEAAERVLRDGLRSQAAMAAFFFQGLVERGIAPVDAVTMTCAWISAFIARPMQPQPPRLDAP